MGIWFTIRYKDGFIECRQGRYTVMLKLPTSSWFIRAYSRLPSAKSAITKTMKRWRKP
jgi:hypothetical protein